MNFAIEDSPEQSAFRAEMREFLARNVPPNLEHSVDPCDMSYEQYQLRRDLGRRMGAKGWLYPSMPKEYGGGDLSAEQVAILHDELSRIGLALPPYYDAGGRMAAPTILVWGTPEHKQRFLPPICRGEVRTWQLLTEPGAGSDLASLKTSAKREGDHYIVNGQKTWTTLAQYADWIFCLVRTDSSAKRQEGISFLLIDMKSPGIEVRPIEEITGGDVHDLNEVFFTDVEVPAENLLGEENGGFHLIMANFQWERLTMALGAVGGMQRVFEATLDYAKEREAFGRPIGRFQAIRHKLAEISIKVEASRALTYATLRKFAAREDAIREVTQAKLFTQRALLEICDEAIQIHGGYGYMREYGIERAYRDARLGPIGGGTDEVMKEILGKQLGL